MKRRVEKALELRKAHKDSFRADNGYSWDYVMVFKVYGPGSKLTESQKNPLTSLKGIVGLLWEAGLQTKLFYSVQVICCCFESLLCNIILIQRYPGSE